MHSDDSDIEMSSPTAAASSSIPILDKLCSGVTGEELFRKDYAGAINEVKENLCLERLEHGGGDNQFRCLISEARKEVWASLATETKEELDRKAKELNSDVSQ